MSTPAQLAANIVNAQSAPSAHSRPTLVPETAASPSQPPNPHGGPRTEAGKATSSKNATTNGLFTQRDFVRPGEEEDYAHAKAGLAEALAPEGPLELNLVGEIHCAIWRLRRCGEVEAHMVIGLDDGSGYIFDPMETANASAEKVQKSVDRARAQSHRLLHKCTAELRKLQTERQYRNEYFDAGTDISLLGICDLRSVKKGIDETVAAEYRGQKCTETDELASILNDYSPRVTKPSTDVSDTSDTSDTSSFCKTPRNAPCPCKSGEKYKRCCGKDAPAVLHAA